jgi:hypothetical protein
MTRAAAPSTLFLALALIALSVVLLRPICDAEAAHAFHGEGTVLAKSPGAELDECCASIGAAAAAVPLGVILPGGGTFDPPDGKVFFLVSAGWYTAGALLASSVWRARLAALPSLPYHVRSARLLR